MDQSQERRLPCPCGTDDADKFSRSNVEGGMFDAGTAIKLARNVFERDQITNREMMKLRYARSKTEAYLRETVPETLTSG